MGSRELGLECDAEQAPIKTTAITVEPRTTIGSADSTLAAYADCKHRPAKLQAIAIECCFGSRVCESLRSAEVDGSGMPGVPDVPGGNIGARSR